MDTTPKIVSLPTRPRETRQQTIEMLEKLLQQAQDGKLVEVAVAWVTDKGAVGTRATKTANVFVMLGAVRVLEHDILNDCLSDCINNEDE